MKILWKNNPEKFKQSKESIKKRTESRINFKQSKESREKISKSLKKSYVGRKHWNIGNKGIPCHTEEHKKELSIKFSGKNNPGYGKTPSHGKRIRYKNILMRSTWEVNVAKKLDELNIKWKYEPKRFYYKDCSYLPDFYLFDLNIWLEVKGWFKEESAKKINHFIKENKLIFINKYNLNNFLQTGKYKILNKEVDIYDYT